MSQSTENNRDAPSGSVAFDSVEINRLLELAEGMQKTCDEIESRMFSRRYFSILVSTMTIVVTLAIFNLIAIGWWIVFVGLAYSAVIIAFTALTEHRLRRKLNRDLRALYSVVDMLREIEGQIAQKNHLSALERAEFRIRLSRFGIGAGARY